VIVPVHFPFNALSFLSSSRGTVENISNDAATFAGSFHAFVNIHPSYDRTIKN